MTPEEKVREKIDGLLHQCGWIVQDRAAINLSASREGARNAGAADSPLQSSSGVPPLSAGEESRDGSATLINYFDPNEPVAFLTGTLPHWRQDGTTYFVTFRLADSLPQEKLIQWGRERDAWMKAHPEPHDEATRRAYSELFPQRIQEWLDAGSGSCILAMPEANEIVENALRHFDAQRYRLSDFVVAANHVHVLVAPLEQNLLSEILHSWKSFTAHKLLKLGSVSQRLQSSTVWQKETFDHIVRSPASLEKFRTYIRAHREYQLQNGSGIAPSSADEGNG